jgi:SAM-dependent methyltransferase
MTAARDTARPLATKEALADWASKQAEVIVTSIKDEEQQAHSAEVVLECGGKIGELKIVKWGSDWLSSKEFEDRLRSSAEIAISFEGDFDYDEDKDDVHPKDFRKDFELLEEIALVLKHDGRILSGTYRWPSSINGDSERSDSNVGKYVRDLIRRVWGEDLQEDEEDRVVGKVRNSDITRSVTVFRVQGEEESF